MDSLKMLQEFDMRFRECVKSACAEWNCTQPNDSFFTKFNERLPDGLRTILGVGVDNGVIVPKGHRFNLKGLGSKKGPYQWFSKPSDSGEPAPNWEYFVQVSEYVRLFPLAAKVGLSLNFEDGLMDIALYQDGKLFVYYEVKEKIDQIQRLITGISAHQARIDLCIPDRGNDPLRKAKYIMEHKPQYFVGVAIGVQLEYRVVYPNSESFQLIKDSVPLSYNPFVKS